MARVWDQSTHGGTELLVLLAIADFADDEGNAYPAVGTLATKCRMSARNVNFILSALRASGELEVQASKGPSGTNRYKVVTGLKPASPPMTSLPLKPASAPEVVSPLKPTSPPIPEVGFTPEAGFTLKPTSSTPEAGFRPPLKPTSDKPSLNHHEPSGRHSVPDGTGVAAVPSTKDELWKAGKSLLSQAGMPERQCGSFIGKLAKDYGDVVALEAVRAAVVERPVDPAGWLKAACGRHKGKPAASSRHAGFDQRNYEVPLDGSIPA
jgi:hypothetical protein